MGDYIYVPFSYNKKRVVNKHLYIIYIVNDTAEHFLHCAL